MLMMFMFLLLLGYAFVVGVVLVHVRAPVWLKILFFCFAMAWLFAAARGPQSKWDTARVDHVTFTVVVTQVVPDSTGLTTGLATCVFVEERSEPIRVPKPIYLVPGTKVRVKQLTAQDGTTRGDYEGVIPATRPATGS